jgi:nicotinamidase-related amidase
MMKLDRTQAVLVLVDMQERLLPVIQDGPRIIENAQRLLRATHLLGIPALVTEQYPKGLGSTVASLRTTIEQTHGGTPFEKLTFSAMGSEVFCNALQTLSRRQILLAGVETHVCVFQTAQDLLANEYEVSLITDAVSSRSADNRDVGIRRMVADGATPSSTEMALFELLRQAGSDEFRAISQLVR